MSDKVDYRLLEQHTIPRLEHEEATPPQARETGRSAGPAL